MDDLLISVETFEACKAISEGMLRTLGDLGYRVPAKKAQLCQTKVTYLGYILKGGKRWLSNVRKETILRISRPRNHSEVREFLESVQLYRLWISGFADLAYDLLSTPQMEKTFNEIKGSLLNALALALPVVTKPFHTYVDERKELVKEVSLQILGPWKRPVAYLSEKLDPMANYASP